MHRVVDRMVVVSLHLYSTLKHPSSALSGHHSQSDMMLSVCRALGDLNSEEGQPSSNLKASINYNSLAEMLFLGPRRATSSNPCTSAQLVVTRPLYLV